MKASVFIFLVLFQIAYAADPATEKFDKFYAAEFSASNEKLEVYIQQLNKCSDEMDKWENEDVFLTPVECPKFDEMRPDLASSLEEIMVVYGSYAELIETVDHSALVLSSPAGEMSLALVRVVSTKFGKVMIQSKRVQEKEKVLIKQFGELKEKFEKLKKLQELESVNRGE